MTAAAAEIAANAPPYDPGRRTAPKRPEGPSFTADIALAAPVDATSREQLAL
jgi:hypothetical protein